jgi:TniQ
MSKPTLIVLPKVLSKESISSWITRVLHEHRLTLSELLGAFGIKKASDIDTSTISGGLGAITNRTSFSPQKLIQMAQAFNWLGINPIKHFVLNRTNGRKAFVSFCPECLKEPIPYWRYMWRFRFYRVCQTHHQPMRFACPHCRKKQICTKMNFKISCGDRKIALRFCCHCSKDLTTAPNRVHASEVINKHLVIQEFLAQFFPGLKTFPKITHQYICNKAESEFVKFLKTRAPTSAELRLLKNALKKMPFKKNLQMASKRISTLYPVPINSTPTPVPPTRKKKPTFHYVSRYDYGDFFADYLEYKDEFN